METINPYISKLPPEPAPTPAQEARRQLEANDMQKCTSPISPGPSPLPNPNLRLVMQVIVILALILAVTIGGLSETLAGLFLSRLP